jgi:hypothetical protein
MVNNVKFASANVQRPIKHELFKEEVYKCRESSKYDDVDFPLLY